ncbi:MAG: tetratricopeptide repeat protein [Deltaproteobacteria bacterium]|nr:tetratricopeptide repeat protein [Deltaproteobacteria bacterium]
MTFSLFRICNTKQSVPFFLISSALCLFLLCSQVYGQQSHSLCYTIQIASYKDIKSSYDAVESLKRKGWKPFYKTIDIPGSGRWYRLLVGKYDSRNEALQAGERLKRQGLIKKVFIHELEKAAKALPSKGMAVTKKSKTTTQRSVPVTNPQKTSVPVNKSGEKSTFVETKIQQEEPVKPRADRGVAIQKKIISDTKEEGIDKEQAAYKVNVPPKETPVSLTEKAKENVSLYDRALLDFQSGRYEDAVKKLTEIIEGNPANVKQKETVLRCLADCYYMLGEKDSDKNNYLKAVDHYRYIIQFYPDSHEKNELVMYRLARSYHILNLYYQGIKEYQNLYTKYPTSVYAAESLFMVGKMLFITRKYDGAVEEFKKYVETYPNGQYVTDAYLQIGDCYTQLHKFDMADYWYEKAIRKWHHLEDVPRDVLMKVGSNYFRVGKYDDALEIFFVYMNLFPEDKECSDVLYKLARSYIGMDRLSLGLKVFTLVIERYPESKEAQESAVMMANMGIKTPGLNVPGYILSGLEHYHNPIDTYEFMMNKVSQPEMKEEILYQKGDAFFHKQQYLQAFDTFTVLLNRFQWGKYNDAVKENLIVCAGYLVNQNFSKKDYIAVSDIYFKAIKNGLSEKCDFETLFKVGISLKNTGLATLATSVFEEMKDMSKNNSNTVRISLALAEIDYDQGRFDSAKKIAMNILKKQPLTDETVLVNTKKLLGDIYYRERLFKKAAGFYADVLGSGKDCDRIDVVYKRYADSLKEMGFSPSALINYKKAISICKNMNSAYCKPIVTGAYEGLGDCFYKAGQYQKGISMYKQSLAYVPENEQNFWTLYEIGRGYMNLNDEISADMAFKSLTEKSREEFWARVVDYYREDRIWSEKYGEYLALN